MQSLKRSLWTATFVIVVCSCYVVAQNYRIWTANTDGFPVEAKYRGFSRRVTNGIESATVTLQKKDDDATITVSLTDLSQTDQDYVKALLEKFQAEREQRRMGGQTEARADFEKRREEARAEFEKRRAEMEAKRKAGEEKRASEKAQREARRPASIAERASPGHSSSPPGPPQGLERATQANNATPTDGEYRTWTDASGCFPFEAMFLGFDGKDVKLKLKESGRIIPKWFETLSPADRAYVLKSTPAIAELPNADESQKAIWTVQAAATALPFVELPHPSGVPSVAFSPDGKKIVTACNDKIARIWDADTGKELQKLAGHKGGINSAAFSPDGNKIVTVSGRTMTNAPGDDRTARIWDAHTGTELIKLEAPNRIGTVPSAIHSAVFSPDGKKIVTVSGDHTARIWDAGTGKELRVFGEPPNEKRLSHPDAINSAVFSRDGKKIVTGCGAFIMGDPLRGPWGTEPGSAKIWDVESGRELRKMEGHTRKVEFAAFSPDEKKIVTVSTGSEDETVRLWDAETGRERHKWEATFSQQSPFPAFAVVFSPDGRIIATASNDYTGSDYAARIWDTASGAEVKKLEGHANTVRSVAFSPDGGKIITTDGECARIWDAASGKELKKIGGRGIGADHSFVPYPVELATFSPEGRKIVTAKSANSMNTDHTVRIWTLE